MNKNVIVVIFSVFLLNSTTECMLKRVPQSLLSCRNYSASKPIDPTITAILQENSAPLSKEAREKQVVAAMAAASAEKLKAHEDEKTKKSIHAGPDEMTIIVPLVFED